MARLSPAEDRAYRGSLVRAPSQPEQAYNASNASVRNTAVLETVHKLGRLHRVSFGLDVLEDVTYSAFPIQMLSDTGTPLIFPPDTHPGPGLHATAADGSAPPLPREFRVWAFTPTYGPDGKIIRPRPRLKTVGTTAALADVPPETMIDSPIWKMLPGIEAPEPPAALPAVQTAAPPGVPPSLRRSSRKASVAAARVPSLDESKLPPSKRRKHRRNYVYINADTGEVVPSP